MKALAEAKAVLLKEMRKLEAEKASYDDRIYRLQQAIGAMDIAEALKRIRRVAYPMVCMNCKEKFFAKAEGAAPYCTKRDCANARQRAQRKGTVLVQGAEK